LHRKGGIVFFVIGLALLFPVYWLLKGGRDGIEDKLPLAFPDGKPDYSRFD
jgi:hypothetical protein